MFASQIRHNTDQGHILDLFDGAQVAEQLMNALGVQTCTDFLRMRGLVSALFSDITADFSLAAALGLGGTTHEPPVQNGAVGRKGIGCERTFAVISKPKELEAKVLSS